MPVVDPNMTYPYFSGRDFDYLIRESRKSLVILLFTTEWLGSAGILEEFLSEILSGRNGIKVYKIDPEKDVPPDARMNVSKLPTVIFLKKGRIADSFTGLIPKKKFESKIGFWIQNSSKHEKETEITHKTER